MTSEQFTYWLQGFMEVANPKQLDEKQTQIIKDHLNLVFIKETPIRQEPKKLEKGLEELLRDQFPSLPKQPSIFGPSKNICLVCGGDHGGLPCTRLAVSC